MGWNRAVSISMKFPLKFATVVRVFLCLLFAGGGLCAEEAGHPEKPMLWKIEGKGLEKPSYLFGTIHLGSEVVTTLHPEAQKAFDAADAVYTEVPMDMPSQVAAAPLMMRKDGQTLNDSLGEEISARLEEELKLINPALKSTPFQPLSTWVIGVTLPLLPDQLAGKKALDVTLWVAAEAAGKKTGALETIESQLGIFSDMSEKDQVIMVSETLRLLEEDRAKGRDSMADLRDAYVTGDTDKVEAEMQKGMDQMAAGGHKELVEKFMKRVLTGRDVSIAATIVRILENEPDTVHFFAAGAGHFSSKTSIRSHLEKAGYTISRIGG